MDVHSIFSIHKKAGPFVNSGSRCAPRIFVRRAQKNTLSDPTSTVGSAEASSFGPRPAQGVFCDVHAAAKYGLEFIRGPQAANSVRFLDAYRGLGDRFIGAAGFLLAKLRRIQFP